MTTTEMIMDAVRNGIEDLSLDDILRGLIEDTDLEEVVCCLDMIAKENGLRVTLHREAGQLYPKPAPLHHRV